MKKYILIIIAGIMALPLFAFNFNDNEFEIDTNIKTEIEAVISQEVNTVITENTEYETSFRNSDNEIIAAINKQMQIAMQDINRSLKFRKNIFTRSLVEEQKIQKQRYEDMLKWDVPGQIYEYIRLNFDLYKVKDIMASCVYHNETLVVVRFNYASSHVIVYYDYNSKQEPITHIVNPM
jgi:hypothetical protein